MNYPRWSAKANVLCTAALCAALSWLTYLGMPQDQVVPIGESAVRLVVWFATPFLGAWMLGAPAWLGLYAVQHLRGQAAPSLTAMVFRAARLIVGVCLATGVWWLATFVLDPTKL